MDGIYFKDNVLFRKCGFLSNGALQLAEKYCRCFEGIGAFRVLIFFTTKDKEHEDSSAHQYISTFAHLPIIHSFAPSLP
jgi:hypothetical protein